MRQPEFPAFRRTVRAPSRQAGVTLIELLTVCAVIGLILALAMPSFRTIINNNRLAGLSNDILATLQIARLEAIRNNVRVIVCNTNDGSTCANGQQWGGMLVFADRNRNATPQADEIIRAEEVEDPLQLWVSTNISGTGARMVFLPDGFAYRNNRTTMLTATLAACLPTDDPAENVRRVDIVSGARLSTSRFAAAAACAAPANP